MPSSRKRSTEDMLLEAREVLRIIDLPDFDPAEFPHNVLTRRLVESVEDLAAENERLRKMLDEAFQSLGRLVHDPTAVKALLEMRAAWLASDSKAGNTNTSTEPAE